MLLDVPTEKQMSSKHKAPWYIFSTVNRERLESKNDELTIRIPRGKYTMDSGGALRANPGRMFPTTRTCTLAYEVFFPESFDLSGLKGGKLPGISLGKEVGDSATGSKWQPDTGSCRLMFREGGIAVGYLYLAVPGGSDDAMRAQSSKYKAVTEAKGGSGHEVWGRKSCEDLLHLRRNAWNRISMKVKLNTPGKQDGFLRVTVNGKTKEVPVLWRSHSRVQITDVNIVCFLGGSSKDWASPKDTHVKFRNFKIALE
jgi:hypothetical protein